MTTKFIYSLRDVKADCFLQPVFERNVQTVVRSLRDVLTDKSHHLTKHVNDFELFELATYDEITGHISPHKEGPIFIVRLEYLLDSEFLPE